MPQLLKQALHQYRHAWLGYG